MWENEWYQYQNGLFENEKFEPRMELWRGALSSRYYQEYWSDIRLQHAPEFRAQIDQITMEIESSAN